MSNKEIYDKMMEHPLKAAFVQTALIEYAKQVVDNKDEVRKDIGANAFINPESWIEIAEDFNKLLNK